MARGLLRVHPPRGPDQPLVVVVWACHRAAPCAVDSRAPAAALDRPAAAVRRIGEFVRFARLT